MTRLLIFLPLVLLSALAHAETPRDFLQQYQREAGPGDAGRGARFFASKSANDWSCATCHTDKPTQSGKHAKTDKLIEPLAPAANPQRFTDAAKVDKWFRRNCNDVLGRVCTAQEKADVLAWLMSQK